MAKKGRTMRYAFLKRYGSDLLVGGLVLGILVFQGPKVWLMQQLMAAGLFQAHADTTRTKNEVTAVVPAFYLMDSKGSLLSTADLKGKVVLINLWASWCPPCRAEMPSLQELYLKVKDRKDIVFLSINEDDDRQKALAYFGNQKLTLPLFWPVREIPPVIFSGTLPSTVVLNRSGQIFYKKEGMANYNNEEFMEQLKKL